LPNRRPDERQNKKHDGSHYTGADVTLLPIHQTDRDVLILSKNEQAMAQASQIYKNRLTLATKKRLLSCAKEISFFAFFPPTDLILCPRDFPRASGGGIHRQVWSLTSSD
jgi:hypothetical protein